MKLPAFQYHRMACLCLILFLFADCNKGTKKGGSSQLGFQPVSEPEKEAGDQLISFNYAPKYEIDVKPYIKEAKKALARNAPEVVVIHPKKFRNWQEAGLSKPGKRFFLIQPGDYRRWGGLQIVNDGTTEQDRKKILCFYNPENADPFKPVLPVDGKPDPTAHVLLEQLDVVNTHHWIFSGLTVSGRKEKGASGQTGGGRNKIRKYSTHIILDHCLIENVVKRHCINIDKSHYNSIQNCIVRNAFPIPHHDNVGILIKGGNYHAEHNRIVNNEIYDCTDGIQLKYQEEWAPKGFVSGTIIENNDIYLTEKMYIRNKDGVFGCAEDGIDIKVGGKSGSGEDLVRVLGNRIWGFRKTDTECGGTGGWGYGVVAHFIADNILLRDNIIFDLPRGISVAPSDNEGFRKTGKVNVAVVNNLLFDIKKTTNEEKEGKAILVNGADVFSNTIKDVEQFFTGESRYHTNFQENVIINASENKNWGKSSDNSTARRNAWYNCEKTNHSNVLSTEPAQNVIEKRNSLDDFKSISFTIKRLTSPGEIVVRNVIPVSTGEHQKLKDDKKQNYWWENLE